MPHSPEQLYKRHLGSMGLENPDLLISRVSKMLAQHSERDVDTWLAEISSKAPAGVHPRGLAVHLLTSTEPVEEKTTPDRYREFQRPADADKPPEFWENELAKADIRGLLARYAPRTSAGMKRTPREDVGRA